MEVTTSVNRTKELAYVSNEPAWISLGAVFKNRTEGKHNEI